MTTEAGGKPFSRVRWGMFCLVFFALPLLLTCFGLGMVWQEEEDRRRDLLGQKMDRLLSSLFRFRDTEVVFEGAFRSLGERVFASPDPTKTFRRLSGRLKKRFPGVFSFILLDGGGNPVAGAGDLEPPRAVVTMLDAALRSAEAGNGEPLKQKWSIFQRFLGSMVKIDDLTGPPEIILATHKKERTFVYVSRGFPRGRFLVFLNQVPDWQVLGIRDRAAAYDRGAAGRAPVRVAVLELEKKYRASPFPTVRLEEVRAALTEFETAPRTLSWSGARLWGVRLLHPTSRLLGVLDDPGNPKLDSQRGRLMACLVALFGALAFGSLKVMRGDWPLFLSIRWKLVLLFLYTAGVPLMVMGLNARRQLLELRSSLESRTHKEREQNLQLFDRKFSLSLGLLQKFLRRTMGGPIPQNADLKRVSQERVEVVIRRLRPSMVGLIDQAGNLVFEVKESASASSRRFNSVLRKFYADILRSLNQRDQGFDAVEEGRVAQMAAIGGIDMNAIISDVVRSMMTVSEYQYGNRKALQAIFPIADAAGQAHYLAIFGWLRPRIEWLYVRTFLARVNRALPHTWLFANNLAHAEWQEPHRFRYRHLVQPFLERLRSQNQVLRARLVVGEETLLMTGIRGEELSEFLLLAVTSDLPIRQEIGRVKTRLTGITLAVLLISGVVASLLASSFLVPVRDLADGVGAIRERNFKLRIPVRDRDELGELSETFNEMMEGLGDLELARIVQESLFPRQTLADGPFAIHGVCRPASQVGGDYFDYYSPAPGNLIVLVGDVSGHGVSAAIVMGMAKGVVAHPAGRHDPAALLSAMNTVLAATLKRQKMMTCFCASLDVPGRRLLFCNAGQNDPLLVRGGKVTSLESRNYLLGVGRIAKFANLECALEPGDTIILYTDGLTEAVAQDGQEVGIPRLQEALPGLCRGTPEETEQAIRGWFDRLVAPGPQADDITIVVIRYLP